MNQKKVTERYKHLRILITRAKEDAERWGTNRKPRVLQGIREESSLDYTIYENSYNKFVQKRLKAMDNPARKEAQGEENHKERPVPNFYSELQLTRIADALEYIVEYLKQYDDKEKQET